MDEKKHSNAEIEHGASVDDNERNHKQLDLYIDLVAIDMSTIKAENKPEADDFWRRLKWSECFTNRKDLEIRFYKNSSKILRRIAKKNEFYILLELPDGRTVDECKGMELYSTIKSFLLHTENAALFRKLERQMPDYKQGYFDLQTQIIPVYKSITFDIGTKKFSPFCQADYLSYRNSFFPCFGDYERSLIESFTDLLQTEKENQADYLHKMVYIQAYIQAVGNLANTEVPKSISPVDIRCTTAYADIVDEICEAADKNRFTGFRCEYIVAGRDRCTLVLFIEDSADRWDGLRYQINFCISLYQLPGVYQGNIESKSLCWSEDGKQFVIDAIFATNDRCNTAKEFSDWVDSYLFGHRVD